MTNHRAALCPCCDTPLRPGWTHWHWHCPNCAYEGSTLEPLINHGSAGLDEDQRREALRALRRHNFNDLLTLLQAGGACTQEGRRRLLDVGAAHGWFVQASAERGWQAVGIEPDEAVAAEAQGQGLAVRKGYFPQALQADERFDVIAFNDVFEHLHDLPDMLAAVRAHLAPEGRLVLNLPSSEGVFFRVARWLARRGLEGPLRRLWQEGMPSPHLHYFNARNLTKLLKRQGFEVEITSQLQSLRREGLMARLRFDPRSAWMAPLIGPLLWLAVPLIQRLPPDIRVLVATDSEAAQRRP